MENIKLDEGQKIMVLWGGSLPTENITDVVKILKEKVTESGKVQLEHIDRLSLASHPDSSFDVVISGVCQPGVISHHIESLGEMCRVLQPGGRLYLHEIVSNTDSTQQLKTSDSLLTEVKLSGFVSISRPTQVPLCDDDKAALIKSKNHGNIDLVQLEASKPNYEIGSSTQLKLSFANKTTVKPSIDPEVAQVWTLNSEDINDEDVELVDSDTLLDDEDLKKPDPASLKANCGTRKKACKDCTCGLAEQLENSGDKTTNSKKSVAATSACGSCYLGDAFRCSSCPYLGMPAFKPGEKVSLTQRQLKADA